MPTIWALFEENQTYRKDATLLALICSYMFRKMILHFGKLSLIYEDSVTNFVIFNYNYGSFWEGEQGYYPYAKKKYLEKEEY